MLFPINSIFNEFYIQNCSEVCISSFWKQLFRQSKFQHLSKKYKPIYQKRRINLITIALFQKAI